jgi:hypothetical protein
MVLLASRVGRTPWGKYTTAPGAWQGSDGIGYSKQKVLSAGDLRAVGGVDRLARASQGSLKRSRTELWAGMKSCGSILGLEEADWRAVG